MFVNVKTQDDLIYNLNLDNCVHIKAYQVGLSFQVTFKMTDGQNITTILTLDSVKKLNKLVDAKTLL